MKFISDAIVTEQDFNTFMAIDNALSVALPRLRLSGVMFFKKPTWRLPKFVRTTHVSADNLAYIVEEYSFNLVTGDIDISMISLPAAALAYKEIKTTSDYKEIPSGSSTSGASGASGTQGPQGEPGPKGEKGEKGDKGDPGPKGDKGDTGQKGEIGATGPQGPQGVRGAIGPQGPQGPIGDPGAAAGFATPTAEAFFIAGGDPSAEVTASGPDTAKKFAFKFWIPKASEVIDSQARLRVRPVLRVVRGYTEEFEINYLAVRHPALSSDKYEAVLMVYRRMNKRKKGVSQIIGNPTVRVSRKGWFAALGDKKITDHAAFTVAGFNDGQGVVMGLAELRDFIVKRFMTDNAHTKAELWGRNYTQWAAESNVSRGFGSAHAARKTFGIAVRWVNPSFTALVDPAKPLSPTTMELTNTSGEKVQRYIYSDVAPLTVELQDKWEAKRASMWFGVSG